MHRIQISLLYCLFVLAVAGGAVAQQRPAPQSAKFRISGVVVNAATGQSLSNIEVSIGPPDSDDSRTVTTTADGHFSFENLAPGKYWLGAEGHNFTFQRFNEHGLFSTAIAVGPNKSSQDLIFRLRPDGTIVGTITDEQGDRVTQAQVMLFRTGMQDGAAATQLREQTGVDDQGHYRFGHLVEGNYYLAVVAHPWYAETHASQSRVELGNPGGQPAGTSADSGQEGQFDVTYPITFYSGVTDPSAATAITVKAGDRVEADLTLTVIRALHLLVSDSTTPQQPITSVLRPQSFAASISERVFGTAIPINANEEFVAPGEMEISGVPPGEFVLGLQMFGDTPSTRVKQVDISDNSQIDAADSPAVFPISGVVQLDDGHPLPQPVSVHLSNTKGTDVSAQTSADGSFEIPAASVSPGKYEVNVGGLRDTLVKSLSATGATVTGHEIEVPPSGGIQLKITVSEGVGRIDGTALRQGQPFAGAMIVLVPQDIEHNSTLVRRDQSDSDGTFSLYQVAPGTYTVIAVQNGWDQQWLNPAVLQPLLKGGEVVNVVPRRKYQIKVNVQ